MTAGPSGGAQLLARVVGLAPPRRQLLLQRMAAEGIDFTQLPLARLPRGGDVPASFAQRRLWFLWKLNPGGSDYNMQVALRLNGALDLNALRRALHLVLERHEALRTTLHHVGDCVVQRIHPPSAVSLEAEEWLTLSRHERRAAVAATVEADALAPFDLERTPPLRVRLLRAELDEHVLLLSMHHALGDGHSIALVLNELMQSYAAFWRGSRPPLPVVGLQYADYAQWQSVWIETEQARAQLAYWTRKLGAEPPVPRWPSRGSRALPGHASRSHSLELAEPLVRDLNAWGRQSGATLPAILLAAFAVLLRCYGGSAEQRIGVPVSNRNRPELDAVVGPLINTLVIRLSVGAALTVEALVQHVQATLTEALQNQDLPFEHLVEALRPQRVGQQNPMFQVMYNHQARPREKLADLGALSVERLRRATPVERFDLTLDTSESGGRVSAEFLHSPALFDDSTLERLAGHWLRALQWMVEHRSSRIEACALLSESERETMLRAWNDTAWRLPDSRSVLEQIEERAEQSGEAVALVFGSESVSYGELNARANQLARRLRAEGVGADGLVGLCAERSLELVVGLLGILKAGGGYLPLEPSYPKERLKYLVEDGGVGVVLTQERWVPQLGEVKARLWRLDRDWNELGGEERGRLPALAGGANVAYCIHTSGSTGKPKGVLSTHEGLSNRLQWMQREYELSRSDCVLQKTPFSFDVSVWEFLWPLMVGAKLAIAAPGAHRDPAALRETIVKQGVTTIHFVPSMLQAFVEAGELEKSVPLRQIMSSGEALGVELSRQVQARHGARLHNLYGPTEASIDVTHWSCGDETERVPIGKPISNTAMYVLDGSMNAVPVGVCGELYIGGVGLARGYVGRAGQTAERFVPNPLGECGERLYRTGDIGRYRQDGALEYLERADQQVKLRGQRIELGEIESRLREHGQVKEAAVVARPAGQGSRLLGYVVLRGELAEAEAEAELKGHLRATLPEAMVPQRIAVLGSLPLTHSGKLDKNALPEPERESAPASAPPKTPLERAVAQIWKAALEVPDVGVDDDFFELGGHSLLAIRVAAQMGEALGKSVPVAAIFESPTIVRVLGAILARSDAEAKTVTRIEPGADGTPLFCIHDGGGSTVGYRALAKALGGQRAVYGVQSRMFSHADWIDASIEAMSAYYAGEVLQQASARRVGILGWSSGGRIALETARQLAQRGCEVVFVGTVDEVWLLDPGLEGRRDARSSAADLDREAIARRQARFSTWAERAHFSARWRRLLELVDDGTRAELLRQFEQRGLDGERLEASAEYLMLRDAQYRLLMARHELRPPPVAAHAWWASESLKQRCPEGPTLRAGFLARSWVVEGDHFSIIDSPRLHEQLGALLAETDRGRQLGATLAAPVARQGG